MTLPDVMLWSTLLPPRPQAYLYRDAGGGHVLSRLRTYADRESFVMALWGTEWSAVVALQLERDGALSR